MTTANTPQPLPPYAAPSGYGPSPKSGPRIGIVVWGVIVTLAGVMTMALSSGRRVDSALLAVLFLVVAGVSILGLSILGAVRSRRTEGATPTRSSPEAWR